MKDAVVVNRTIMEVIEKHCFLFGIVLILTCVIFDKTGNLARAGIFLKDHQGPSFMIFFIFLLSGMIIDGDQIKAGIKDVKATIAALVVIVIIAPCRLCLCFYTYGNRYCPGPFPCGGHAHNIV